MVVVVLLFIAACNGQFSLWEFDVASKLFTPQKQKV